MRNQVLFHSPTNLFVSQLITVSLIFLARVAGLLQGEGSQPHVPSPTQLQRRNITLLTSFNVVDNSQLGQRAKRYRKPYLIGFYRKRKTAEIGDVIRVAVGGKTNKAIVVGTRRTKHHTVPRFDNNNIVLVDDNLAPLGTRIKGPVPTIIKRRQRKYSKVLATASRFI